MDACLVALLAAQPAAHELSTSEQPEQSWLRCRRFPNFQSSWKGGGSLCESHIAACVKLILQRNWNSTDLQPLAFPLP